MERTLIRLFDFQRFEGNRALQAVIDDVHSRYAMRELRDNDLVFVNAAGAAGINQKSGSRRKPGES